MVAASTGVTFVSMREAAGATPIGVGNRDVPNGKGTETNQLAQGLG